MEAVVLREHGGPEVLVREQIPRPEPGPGEVRVRVAAVAMNHMDLWVRKGGPAFHVEYPHRLGCDVAGTVDAVGPGVEASLVGQRTVVNPGLSCGHCAACLSGADNLCRRYRILGENTQGGYAEHLVVPRANLAPYPGDLGFPEAAACLLTFLTAWQMLVHKARVGPGDTVLVQGAGSGVGVAAIQIARLHGARVIATAGSDAKVARALELGAEHGINYRTADFVAEAKRLTGKRGVDVVVEHVGGDTFAASIRATRNGGRVVTCGATAGFTPQIDLRHVFFRQVEILGSTMGSKGDLFAVLDHVAAGRLRPVIHAVLPLARAAEGHRILEAREAFGKIVLEPGRAP
ncbi:MAG: zinc-binding dehydrogenase [Kofleriaceae bacterium]|nr:zinc-binding dehydrogenase [Myxococcales bacterium]MCB9573305.1 zinc-binding dehydrogenase [Kofleriaceae bacterium]